MQINFIGDIHGYAVELKLLLKRLGYYKSEMGDWKRGDGFLLFLGDLIDRGPHQKETVEIVRELCELGYGLCLMGNHEFNAVGCVTDRIDQPGTYVRSHTDNHIRQHEGFLEAYGQDTYSYNEAIEWFANLPLWYEAENVRAIHAYWNPPSQAVLKPYLSASHRPKSRTFFAKAGVSGSAVWEARETLLNGLEAQLPNESFFQDYYGIKRRRIRVNWWSPGQETYRQAAVIDDEQRNDLPNLPLPIRAPTYQGPMCFFGHYWMRGLPRILHPRAICLDYSIAFHDGVLCAYQFQGEQIAKQEHFIWTPRA